MTCLKIYLKNRSKIVLLFALIALLGCSKEKVNPGVIAKVGNEYLTEADVKETLGEKYGNKNREEFIHRWIEERIFYLEARREKIINGRNYKNIVESDKAEIARGLLLQRKLNEENFSVSSKELLDYYLKNKINFVLDAPAFNFDYAEFNDRSSAEKFRSLIIQKNWEFAARTFQNSEQLVKLQANLFKKSYEIFPAGLRNILSRLDSGDVSIALKTGKNKFIVLHLIKSYLKGEIPPLEIIKPLIKEELLILKKQKYLNEYTNSLYSKYDVEIFRK